MNIKFYYALFPQIFIPLFFFISTKNIPKINLFLHFILEPTFTFLLYILLKKIIREIWALYDSFKRSFYNVNQGILESDPNPIFIISKDKNILYKNATASKLVKNILDNPSQISPRKMQRIKETTINFLDIVHPNLRELFKKLISDALEDNKVSSFNFPLCKIHNQQNSNINISNAYDIYNEKNYLYFVWFRILICKTEWKNKSAYYISLFPSENVLLNEIFYQYTKRFSEKVEKVISNTDIICSAFINKIENKKNNKKEKKVESKSSSISSSEDLLSKNSDSIEEDGTSIEGKKNIYQLLIENQDNTELNNIILFFFKNQVELLYDYSLTIEIYFNMIYKQRYFKYSLENEKPNLKKRIKLNELKAYYSEYFYDFIKEHKYSLEFQDDDKNIFDIFIEENYLRIIIFNVIVFMVCHLDDKSEPTLENKKEIIIKIIPELKDEDSIIKENLSANWNQKKKYLMFITIVEKI